MITNEQIKKYLSSLKAHTITSARENQKFRVPLLVENIIDADHLSTHDESFKIETEESKKSAKITNVKEYRFDGRWYTYHNSVDKPNETFGILKVDDLPLNIFTNKINKKTFIGRLDRLVFQGMIEPFLLFIEYKLVNWDNIEIVYDCDDTWLILRGEQYNYDSLKNKTYDMLIMPFKCEFLAEEPDWLFDVNYNAFCKYIQDTSYIKEDKLYILSPTLDTEYDYNNTMYNVGGWAYAQIKRYGLGLLSNDRINKLRYISVFKYIYNDYGDIVDSISTRYNLLDKDVPTNKDLYDQLVFMPYEKYNNYPMLRFTSDGLQSDNGDYKLVILDEDIIYRYMESTDDKLLFNLSEIKNLLFRENYVVFENGLLSPYYPIMTSINNITFCDNPENKNVNIKVLYNKRTDHVIRNSDRFLTSYMNEQARIYLQVLYHTRYAVREEVDAISEDYNMYTNIDAVDLSKISNGTIRVGENVITLTPNNDEIEILKRDTAFAELETGEVVRNLETYYLDTEFAFVPSITDYAVFLNDIQNDAVELVKKAITALDFKFKITDLYEDNINNALDDIIKYNPSLLNPLYHKFIDQYTFTGKQANESLIYQFMYESRRGIKIPRKRYKNHESYIMVFVNGELIENYYKMIAYANFFFIPIDDDFEFDEYDKVEVLFFKNVNNNEIRFKIDHWVNNEDDYFGIDLEDSGTSYYRFIAKDLDTGEYFSFSISGYLKENNEDPNFYDMDVFRPFIRPKELQLFSYYPKHMLEYPTLITRPDRGIAFNISYRDDDNNLCIKADGIEHLMSNETFEGFSDEEVDATKCLVATSKHKFIYQRLYVDRRSYRIKLDKRFRYCDNPSQYLLFVNGRRMKQDSFLITIPKHTRPFTGLYLYTARFVGPEDRVELFYLPYSMHDINFDTNAEFNEQGYLQFDRSKLNLPLSKDLYIFFMNGKKIPATDIVDIDSNTIRLKVDPATMKYPSITAICVETIDKVKNFLHDEFKISDNDDLVNYIKTHSKKPWDELNKALGIYNTITDIEEDKVWANVAKIAILNEIVRDFWVTSGYDYQKQLFVYDYEKDELYEKMADGTLILPALDATPEINIIKNDISLLYFYTYPEGLLFEIGDVAKKLIFSWEYSQRLNQDWHIISQRLNGIEIDVNARDFEWNEEIHNPRRFRFIANTGQEYLVHDTYLDFVNGIYWGVIDEDVLQHYKYERMLQYMDELIAVIPKDNAPIPTVAEQTLYANNKKLNDRIPDENYIVWGMSYEKISEHIGTPWTVAVQDYDRSYQGFMAFNIYTGEMYDNILAYTYDTGEYITDLGYYLHYGPRKPREYLGYTGERDLPSIIDRLDKYLIRTPNIKLNDYIIGNNNYFVFACPKRLVYDTYKYYAEFYFPDPNGEDIVAHCRDDKTTPVYTDGVLDSKSKLLTKLYDMHMEYMGECLYTNEYGFREAYMVWKTNGFFTRLFENYGIDIRIKIGNFVTKSEVVFNHTKQIYDTINYINGEREQILDDVFYSVYAITDEDDVFDLLFAETVDSDVIEDIGYYAPGINTGRVVYNATEQETETMDVAGNANTLPADNAASITKNPTKVIRTNSNEPADGTVHNISGGVIDISEAHDDKEVIDLLNQGIFII